MRSNQTAAPARLAAILAMLLSLNACSSMGKVALSDKTSLQLVAIDPVVQIPSRMNYYDLKRSYAVMFSMVAAKLIDKSNQSTLSDLKQLSDMNGISVADIVHKEFVSQWGKSTGHSFTPQADQIISLEVLNYGLSVASLSSQELVPTLNVKATMKDADGEVLWRASSQLSSLENPVPTMCMDDFFVKPDYLRSAWSHAAKQVVSKIVAQAVN